MARGNASKRPVVIGGLTNSSSSSLSGPVNSVTSAPVTPLPDQSVSIKPNDSVQVSPDTAAKTEDDSMNRDASLEAQRSSLYSEQSESTKDTSSILVPHPLLDSLTIFILIVQFPSLIVSFIHVVFACLTFIPPSVPSSSFISSLTHSTPSSPNLLTILFADVAVAVVSIFFLPKMRGVMVDLGSAVISSTLSGGGTKIAFYCTSMLQLGRIIRHSFFLIRRDSLSPVSTPPLYVPEVSAFDEILAPTPQYYLATSTSGISRIWDMLSGSAGWFGQAMAVHVVGQSMLYSIRRMFLEQGNRLSSMPAASSPGMDGYGIDYEAATYQTQAKKKKKPVPAYKHQQPSIWTALANTLVLASRGEAKPDTDKSQEGQSLLSSLISDDPANNGLGYRPSATEPALYSCVRYVLENEVAFEISPAGVSVDASLTGVAPDAVYDGVSVRVNGILWPEVSVQTVVQHETDPIVQALEDAVADEVDDVERETLLVVSGLTPITEYEIEVCKRFASRRQVTICRTNICTSPKEQSVSSQQPSRPLSPVTTLLDTLCTTNALLCDEKQKLKRSRREHSKHLSALRSEIDSLRSRLGTVDKGDERAWRRVLALRESVRRTEEEIEALNAEMESLEKEESAVELEIGVRKQAWENTMAELEVVKSEFSAFEDEIGNRERGLANDESAVQVRRDRLLSRHKKLLLDFQRADQERRCAWDREFARRKVQREQLRDRRQAIEAEFSASITTMEKGIDDIKERTAGVWQSASMISEASAMTVSPAVSLTDVPSNPELELEREV
ncbi:hypothetical protein V1512DRAFT_220817 [Lipomyces arxii]|uniref:uncharacterized protein n=1 Tax=Lipomyces arxii TaxID=56418 RepID=UPI0034D0121C